ncbi:localization factor PodJL [Rhizobium sp. NFR07]|uniref:peptidoglycan-binding protein n=1 Tax=Rhizobium sp. NFR07 TaxID=1566262 RepID=UPI0008E02F03|nr:peptidoglycan-binding protein [Rhizobium sp. NFR07]SFA98749.1 localization factor PodJL [Rhizobium sp. NFR07]
MNGSRSAPPRHGDRSSLDALNRTIEGLEARIQGLMAGAGRTAYQERAVVGAPAPVAAAAPYPATLPPAQHGSQHTGGTTRSVLAEIRERQRALEDAAQRVQASQPAKETYVEAPRMPAPRMAERPAAPMHERVQQTEARRGAAPLADPSRQRMVAARLSDATHRGDAGAAPGAASGIQDFNDALARLRQDLKRDFSDGFGREMKALRDEVRAIKLQAEDHRLSPNVESDLTRLAQGIDQLTMQATPEAAGLRAEFEELRVVMDGLARETSLQQMQNQWQGLEERIQEADASALREEIVALAYRTDEIRNQLGLMADSPVIRALEEKLLSLAGMMEKLGTRMQPTDAELGKQFGMLDQRLDEISRAIAANVRAPASTALDDIALQRLEGRLGALMDHVEDIGRATSDTKATDGLSLRIELLAGKIEELAEEQAAARLEERIEQLTALIHELQPPAGQTEELTGYLSDISRKIDALDSNFTEHGLGERLEYLAQRIDEMEKQPAADEESNAAFGRIEDRLSDIAARLDEASAAPQNNDDALRGLEAQIAHLSTLISQPSGTSAWSPEFDTRMAAIEGYMATNDEYIVEAARQAAETVIEAYSRNLVAGTASSGADVAALSGLAEDLKHLEDLARNSENRTHQTFEALHGTLVQIAERLDKLEGQISGGSARAPHAEEAPRQQMFASAAPARQQVAPAVAATDPAMAPALSVELVEELAGMNTGQTEAKLRDSSAISSTLSDHIPAHAEPVEIDGEDEQAPAKSGLLSGLTRRFRSGGKQEAAPVARTLVEPAPSIDPSEAMGDVLPPERENDLLEPGSGAPDVKKILEKVRASQAAGEFDREKSGERADYIAAARRAAKAAAQEADPSQRGSLPKAEVKSGKGKVGAAKAAKGPSAFSQHRRPILMAVGAVLLALMAMPLIKTVTTSQEPQMAAVEAPAEENTEQSAAPETTPATTADSTTTDMATDQPPMPEVQTPPDTGSEMAAEGNGTDGPANDATSDATAQDGAMPESLAEMPEPTRTQSETAPAASSEQPAATASADIVVPAGIEPKSLADAASGGDANALFEIGARFSDGRGVKADPAEASRWYRLAADRGLPPAQYRLGNMLEKGTGVVRNLDEALSYYRLAAEAGNSSAMHNLAVLYASGVTGKPDYAAAVEWFRNAANHGVVDSQFNLAILYARGNGVKQDLEESYKWFGAAANGGDTDAAEKRDEVAKAMRKEQLDSARAKLDAWKAMPLDPKSNSVDIPDEWASGKGVTTASVDMTKAIRNIQAILNRNGFDAGTPDGKMGAKTVAAIKAFQNSIGQEATGKVNDALVRELLARNG